MFYKLVYAARTYKYAEHLHRVYATYLQVRESSISFFRYRCAVVRITWKRYSRTTTDINIIEIPQIRETYIARFHFRVHEHEIHEQLHPGSSAILDTARSVSFQHPQLRSEQLHRSSILLEDIYCRSPSRLQHAWGKEKKRSKTDNHQSTHLRYIVSIFPSPRTAQGLGDFASFLDFRKFGLATKMSLNIVQLKRTRGQN